MKLLVYAIKDLDNNIKYKTVDSPNEQILLCLLTKDGSRVFQGPAYQLQMWAAKRGLEFQQVTLNVPVEVLGGSL